LWDSANSLTLATTTETLPSMKPKDDAFPGYMAFTGYQPNRKANWAFLTTSFFDEILGIKNVQALAFLVVPNS